jgi:hypothetical protein
VLAGADRARGWGKIREMGPYATRAWTGVGADHVLAYPGQAPGAGSRLPTIVELLADIHALDAEIRRTSDEIAVQVEPTPLRGVAFVDQSWRPFVSYWDRVMREVYEYEHGAQRGRAPDVATAALLFWGARSRYYDLRRDAASWGFHLDTPTSVGFWPYLGAGVLGILAGYGAGTAAVEAARRVAATISERQRAADAEEWGAFVARRDQEWQALVARRDQEWLSQVSPSYGY